MVPLGSAARFGAAHRAFNQAVHSVPTTACAELLSEKCRGSTSDPMDAFFSIAILTGLRAALAGGLEQRRDGVRTRTQELAAFYSNVSRVKLLVSHYTSSMSMSAARG